MKYAVLGSTGQLGRDLCPKLAGEVTALTRENADLTCIAVTGSVVRTPASSDRTCLS